MNKEIGSEFWQSSASTEAGPGRQGADAACLISGMAAIDHIIKDIRHHRPFRSVAVPSYCCESMILPFLNRGVKVFFYNVSAASLSVDADDRWDGILLIDYFGYDMPEMVALAKKYAGAGRVVIYDSTHKLNGNPRLEAFADYGLISYRKWCYANFAEAFSYRQPFWEPSPSAINGRYISLRHDAALQKTAYIQGDAVEKSSFLQLYGKAEEELDHNYAEFSGVPSFIDTEDILSRRRANAKVLTNALSSLPGAHLWRPSVSENDSPLFVPLLVDKKQRSKLKQYLISRDIYCPVHWPFSSWHGPHSDLYDEEISLICDQRYDRKDMMRIAETLYDFFDAERQVF